MSHITLIHFETDKAQYRGQELERAGHKVTLYIGQSGGILQVFIDGGR